MRIEDWMTITAATAMTVCGQQASTRLDRSASVCLGQGRSALAAAQPGVSRIFAQIGVTIDWRNDSRPCDEEDGAIVIRPSYGKPGNKFEDAFGYALPYEGTHVVVFWDHVKETTRATGAQNLLAYVIAHEIGHALERVNRHSATGIMKACWEKDDFFDIGKARLKFAPADVSLIYLGLDLRKGPAGRQ